MTTYDIGADEVDSSFVLSAGDVMHVSLGGVASSTTVLPGAVEYILADGEDDNSLIEGGTLDVIGATFGATVDDLGQIVIENGGSGMGLLVGSAGKVVVEAGGYVDRSTVSGFVLVSSAGLAVDLTIAAGGVVEDIGVVFSTTVLSGGEEVVLDRQGPEEGSTIYSGGVQTVLGGGFVSGTVLSGGLEVLSAGSDATKIEVRGGVVQVGLFASVEDMTVSAGGVVNDRGYVFGALIQSGANLQISSGGVGELDYTSSGGVLTVSSGGLISTGVVIGGREVILSGGVDLGTEVYSGTEYVSGGGVSISSTIHATAHEILTPGGLASSAHVLSGGLLSILSGGVASGLMADAGGQVTDNGTVVISGTRIIGGKLAGAGVIAQTAAGALALRGVGTGFTGTAVISAGRIELTGAHAIGTGSVVFAAGSTMKTLQLDAADAPAPGGFFANVISNFRGANDFIDLRSVAFVSGAKATAAATASGWNLTLSDGGKSYKFHLTGGIGSTFSVTSDGHGGTMIEPHVGVFAQAAAALSPSKAAVTSPIITGGTSGHAALLNTTGSAGGRA